MHKRVEEAYAFFQEQGWSKEQSAGIVGNLMAECGPNLDFEHATGDGGTAHGLAQWRNERVAKFKEVFGKALNRSDFVDQLSYVHWELSDPHSSERRAGEKLKRTTTAAEAAAIMDQYYERSSGEARGIRQRYAEQILKTFG